MEKEPLVRLSNIKKNIGRKKIIQGISLDIYRGEVFGFLGPNGAGKTTVIRMLVGLIKPTGGTIHINGNDIEKNFEKAIQHVGGIIENPEMYKHLTGYENLIHYSRMFPKKISKERINEVIKLVGLDSRIHEKVHGYSLGMRQRLGVAQALLHQPSLLILDEPTNGLDPAGIKEIRQYIRRIAHEEGMAVFVSSHLLSEMQLMCDRIGIVNKGQLISVQTTTDFIGAASKQLWSIEVAIEQVDDALKELNQGFPEQSFIKNEMKIEGRCDRENVPLMVSHLVEKGYRIYGINDEKKTLEEKFLEITEGR